MNSDLKSGDVVLIKETGWGLLEQDCSKYVELISFTDEGYYGEPGWTIKAYDSGLWTSKPGNAEGYIGVESFGTNPLVLLNTKEDSVEVYTTNPLSALDKQVSGGHYKGCKIQPVEYIQANGLDYFQGNVIKYTTRHKLKNGKADIEKAIHYLELILELQYGD